MAGAFRPRKLRRTIVLAGAPLTVLLAAVVWLVTFPDTPQGVSAPAPPLAAKPAAAPAPRPVASAPAPPALQPAPRGVPVVAPTKAAAAAPGRQPPFPVVSTPGFARGGSPADAKIAVEPEARRIMEVALDDLVRQVDAETDMLAKLRRIDRMMIEPPPKRALDVMERLLDASPRKPEGGALTLKIGLVSRLAVYREDERAERRLVGQAQDQEVPRAIRLTAIDALRRGGPVREGARPAIERLADQEPDVEVKRRARWALGRPEGG